MPKFQVLGAGLKLEGSIIYHVYRGSLSWNTNRVLLTQYMNKEHTRSQSCFLQKKMGVAQLTPLSPNGHGIIGTSFFLFFFFSLNDLKILDLGDQNLIFSPKSSLVNQQSWPHISATCHVYSNVFLFFKACPGGDIFFRTTYPYWNRIVASWSETSFTIDRHCIHSQLEYIIVLSIYSVKVINLL